MAVIDQISNLVNLILDGALGIVTIILLLVMLKRGSLKYLPRPLFIYLLMVLIMGMCFDVKNVYLQITKGNDLELENYEPDTIEVFF